MEGTFATASYTGGEMLFMQWSFWGNLLFVCLFVQFIFNLFKNKQDKKKKTDKNMYMRLHLRNITNQIRITKKQEQEEKILQSYPIFLLLTHTIHDSFSVYISLIFTHASYEG